MARAAAVLAASLAATLTCSAGDDDFELEIVRAGTADEHVIVLPTGTSVDLEILLTMHRDGVQGWSYGVRLEVDPGLTAVITQLQTGRDAAVVRDGIPGDYDYSHWFTDDLHEPTGTCGPYVEPCQNISASAFTHGVTIGGMTPAYNLEARADFVCAEFSIHVEGPPGAQVRLVFSDDVGRPPLATVVIQDGLSHAPAIQTPATITLTEPPDFRRGDVNGDGTVNLADPIWNLEELFYNGPATPCPDAADADNDGIRTIGDSIYLLYYLFKSGPQPPLPFPGCGLDETDDGLGCMAYEACP